jgi:aryl-alcohol dehydrogenase-like predicted oxidoreductase
MKLGLGTVQFGMDYGISNVKGRPQDSEVDQILKLATKNGVSVLDTAAQYGNSEETLGNLLPEDHQFKIITKGLTTDVLNSFPQSLEKLRQKNLYGILIHDTHNLTRHGGTNLLNQVRHFRERGLVKKIGVSAYTQLEIDRVLELFPIDIVQVPLNIFDQRLIKTGYLRKLKDQGIEIHVRSSFLQGLLLMPPDKLPDEFDSVRGHLKSIVLAAKEKGLSMLQLALGFVLNTREVDHVIVGVTSLKEFQEIIGASESSLTQDAAILDICSATSLIDEKILNPSLWRKNA